jgi:hypothetical protein
MRDENRETRRRKIKDENEGMNGRKISKRKTERSDCPDLRRIRKSPTSSRTAKSDFDRAKEGAFRLLQNFADGAHLQV